MKKSVFGILMIGMILGTSTVFGKTNVKPGNNRMNDRMEVRVSTPNRHMDGKRMDKPVPVPEHRHEFGGPDHRCHICGITEHEWHMMMDKDMHHTSTPTPSHFRR